MTKEEWIKTYEEKTGDEHKLPDGFREKYLPDKGYCQYGVDTENGVLYIYEVCGDGKFWHDVGRLICLEKGLSRIATICTRNLKPYIRLFGGKVTEEIVMKDGTLRLFGTNVDGRRFVAYPAWFDYEKNKYAYYVITEVGES